MPFIPNGIESTVPQNYSPASVRQRRTARVLVPHVVVTPEFTALEAGQHSLWTVIEISGRLSEVASGRSNTGGGEQLDIVTNPFSSNDRGSYTQGPISLLQRLMADNNYSRRSL